jgi:tuftelin-interacting protein 11
LLFDPTPLVISRLQQVSLVATELSNHSKELVSVYEASLDSFTPYIRKLLDQFSPEFDKYRLDEIVVAAISPIVSFYFIL